MLEQIKQILRSKASEFAQRIAPVFRILDIRWTSGVDYFILVIPGESEITSLINTLIDGLCEDSKGFYSSRGGLTVGYVVKNSNVQPVLQFTISELAPRIIQTTATEIKEEEKEDEKKSEYRAIEYNPDVSKSEDSGERGKES